MASSAANAKTANHDSLLMNSAPDKRGSGWDSWYPTLRKEREGWSTRHPAILAPHYHPSSRARDLGGSQVLRGNLLPGIRDGAGIRKGNRHLLKLLDLDLAVGEDSLDLKLPAHRLNEAAQAGGPGFIDRFITLWVTPVPCISTSAAF